MTPILPTLTVLALLVGISGCFHPVVWEQWSWRGDRPGDRYSEGGRDHSGSDCWRDGQSHCRDD
jgi:hypothetical protein